MSKYKFKIAWCRICDQGWVQILKDLDINKLFLCCSECLTEWKSPEDYNSLKPGTNGKHTHAGQPTIDEIAHAGWSNYLIK